MTASNASGVVSIGIDTAIVADHQVAIRGPAIREDFRVAPTLAGLARLTERLAPFAGSLVVAEPTGGSWFPLSHAVTDAGCAIGFVQNQDSARLREAIAGHNKTDAIDADMLARCEQVLGVEARPLVASSTSTAEAGYLGDDPDDPSRTLIRQVLGAVSQYERSMIALRLRSGRRRKAQHGGYAFGAPRSATEPRTASFTATTPSRRRWHGCASYMPRA